MDSKGMIHKLIIAGAGVLLIGAIAMTAFMLFQEHPCDTKECFIKAANACEKTSYEQDELGTIFHFDSDADCSVTKSVKVVSAAEPDEIQALFLNTQMTCKYTQGSFDVRILDTLSQGLEACTGTLKESVYTLMIAEYELQMEAGELEYPEDDLVLEEINETFS